MDPHCVYQDEVLWLQNGDDLVYKQKLLTNNSCLRMEYQVGVADLATQAATWILARAYQNIFFTEMRTKQMLGYIVFSGDYKRENVQSLVFIIQSGTHSARDLFNRADTFLASLPDFIAKMPDEKFEAIRQSLIQDPPQRAKVNCRESR